MKGDHLIYRGIDGGRGRMSMKRVIEKAAFSGRAVVCGCLTAVLLSVVPAGVKAKAGGSGKTRFCLVIPPEIKKSANIQPRTVMPVRGSTASEAAGKRISFFSGKMEKLGVGAPDCFDIGTRSKKAALVGPDAVYSDLNGYVDALNGELEVESFFPSVGYFNRASRGNKSAVAFGVGLKGPSGNPGDRDEGSRNPSAGVSLMFGFGF